MSNPERRALIPDHMTECECGAWVSHDEAFSCDDGPMLCESCSPTEADIARQKAEMRDGPL
jgi:hypothetical protein